MEPRLNVIMPTVSSVAACCVRSTAHSFCYALSMPPKTPPGSHEMGPSDPAARWLQRAHKIIIRTHAGVSVALSAFLSLVTLTFDLWPHTRSWARFLYSVPDLRLQVWSSYV